LTEIALRLARPRAAIRALQALVLVAGLAFVATGLIVLRPHAAERVRVEPASVVGTKRGAAARAYAEHALSVRAEVSTQAARSFGRTLFISSPGGVLAAAARVNRLRPLVVRAARGSSFSANAVEAVLLIELPPHGFAPRKVLRAIVRDLRRARLHLGRGDLALEAHRMGIVNLQRVIAAHGTVEPAYADLYFGSTSHRGGDYYWTVLAAERVMRLYRHDRAALAYEAHLQARKNSSEEVMHPRSSTPQFRTPTAIARAWRQHVLRAIPRNSSWTHIAISRFMGEEAHKLGRSARLYRGLRPATLDVLLYIGKRVHTLSGAKRPLLVTSAVRDSRYQRVLLRVNANAARSYSLHTTGYAFDIARAYGSRRQAAAFQLVLDRLQAVNAIAYIREAAAIHIAVASDAPSKLALLNLG
jgi:uncharacterized protein YcbK (DUF882 family)